MDSLHDDYWGWKGNGYLTVIQVTVTGMVAVSGEVAGEILRPQDLRTKTLSFDFIKPCICLYCFQA